MLNNIVSVVDHGDRYYGVVLYRANDAHDAYHVTVLPRMNHEQLKGLFHLMPHNLTYDMVSDTNTPNLTKAMMLARLETMEESQELTMAYGSDD